MNSISPKQLQQKILAKHDFVLIDVREDFEHEHFNIGGMLIPMGTVFEHLDVIPKNKTVIMYCAKGIRSNIIIQRLQDKYGYTNLVNLTGGLQAWQKDIVVL